MIWEDYLSFEKKVAKEFKGLWKVRYSQVINQYKVMKTDHQALQILSLVTRDLEEISEKLLPGVSSKVPESFITAKVYGKELVQGIRFDGDIFTIAEIAVSHVIRTYPEYQDYGRVSKVVSNNSAARDFLKQVLENSDNGSKAVVQALAVFEDTITHSNLADKTKKLETVRKLANNIIEGIERAS